MTGTFNDGGKMSEEDEQKSQSILKKRDGAENSTSGSAKVHSRPPPPPHHQPRQLRHQIYEVTNIPVLKSHRVPLNEKVPLLKRMRFHDEIKVKQYFEDTEDIVGFKMSNTYAVTVPNKISFDPTEESVLYIIGEKISCEMSWLKTSSRTLQFCILSPEGDVVGFINRACQPCFCMTNICPCAAHNKMNVSLADGRHFGRVQKNCRFSTAKFSIYDSADNHVFTIEGATLSHVFPCWLIQNTAWKILKSTEEVKKEGHTLGRASKPHAHDIPNVEAEDPNDDDAAMSSVAFIASTRTPACEENVYTLKVEHVLDVKYKMLLIALIVLIDFQHFRRCSGICHCLTFLFWLTVFCGTATFLFYYFVVMDQM